MKDRDSTVELERLVATLLFAKRTSDPNRRQELLDSAIKQVLPGGQLDSPATASVRPRRETLYSTIQAGERTQALHRATEELAGAGGWQWNAQTDDFQLTPGTYDLLDISRDTALDMETAFSYLHPDDRPKLEAAIDQCLETGVPYDLELRLETANNRIRWVRIRGEAIDADGDREDLRGAIVDVTTMKEREQRLQVLNRILRHNLRNSLNVILGRAELLSEELGALDVPSVLYEMDDVSPFLLELERLSQDADSLHEEIEIVREGMEFLVSFPIEDAKASTEVILKKSRELDQLTEKARDLDAVIGEMSGHIPSPIAVRPVLERVQRTFASEFPEATIDIDCRDELRVLGLEAPLERAIGELVENALSHGGTGDTAVKIAASDGADGRLQIRVTDNGPGIPQIERETLRRESETPMVHGQGIGLWLVSWIVRRLNGTIAIHDREPQGSIICLDLPQPPADDKQGRENRTRR